MTTRGIQRAVASEIDSDEEKRTLGALANSESRIERERTEQIIQAVKNGDVSFLGKASQKLAEDGGWICDTCRKIGQGRKGKRCTPVPSTTMRGGMYLQCQISSSQRQRSTYLRAIEASEYNGPLFNPNDPSLASSSSSSSDSDSDDDRPSSNTAATSASQKRRHKKTKKHHKHKSKRHCGDTPASGAPSSVSVAPGANTSPATPLQIEAGLRDIRVLLRKTSAFKRDPDLVDFVLSVFKTGLRGDSTDEVATWEESIKGHIKGYQESL